MNEHGISHSSYLQYRCTMYIVLQPTIMCSNQVKVLLVVATYNKYVFPSLLFFSKECLKVILWRKIKLLKRWQFQMHGEEDFLSFLSCVRITPQWCGHWIPITIMFSYLEGNKEGNILYTTLIRCLWAFIWQIDILYT